MNSQQGINALFQHATEGILVVNDKGIIISINPSAEKLFGYEQGELNGQLIEKLIPKKFADTHHKHREKYAKKPQARSMGIGMELYAKRKDDTEFPVEISLSPYSNDEGNFTIAFIIDITIRKQAEEKLKNYSMELENQVKKRTLILEEAVDELEKTKLELNNALEKERELNELKSRFVSMASHEFRTPLATILSSVALVSKYGDLNDREKQDKHIAKIKASIGNLTDILNDFLSVSKLEEGKVEWVPEEFYLDEFINGVVKEMEPLTKPEQTLVYKHSGSKTARLDKKLTKNILFNLISNAIKFSPEGREIEISSVVNKSEVTLTIKDQGIGISKEDQKHLFERFFRAQNATYIQGTGLGLNIVLRYIELMKGTINFKSEENKGTTFIITLPQ